MNSTSGIAQICMASPSMLSATAPSIATAPTHPVSINTLRLDRSDNRPQI